MGVQRDTREKALLKEEYYILYFVYFQRIKVTGNIRASKCKPVFEEI